jgi:hypothetical protein
MKKKNIFLFQTLDGNISRGKTKLKEQITLPSIGGRFGIICRIELSEHSPNRVL